MIFKQKYKIGIDNINQNLELNNKSVLLYLEDIACKHSDTVQNGVEDIKNNGFTFVLLEWKVQILSRPKYGDTIEVHTWAKKCDKLYANRDFEIYVNGKKKIIATSKWILIDVNTFKPIKIKEEVINKYGIEEKEVFEEKGIKRLREQSEYSQKTNYYIRKSDIDINNHVNNINYMDMAEEVMNKYNNYNNIRIYYKKQIKYGNEIEIYSTQKEDTHYFKIFNKTDGTTSALIELE